MAEYLLNFPSELQVSIFGSCEDLDDALHFSHACRDLRGVFQTHRRIIEKEIIVGYEKFFSLLARSRKLIESTIDFLSCLRL